MRIACGLALLSLALSGISFAAPKTHVIAFGKWNSVQYFVGPGETKALALKVRALYVDGHLKEFVFDPPHEITDRMFAVHRILRINDALPQESSTVARWVWQPAGWILVDRLTGHLSAINLPEFDSGHSSATWYRDYIAYCGISDDGKKRDAIVIQLGRRKPILKAALGDDPPGREPCAAPTWERKPARVSFAKAGEKLTYSIGERSLAIVSENDDEDTE